MKRSIKSDALKEWRQQSRRALLNLIIFNEHEFTDTGINMQTSRLVSHSVPESPSVAECMAAVLGRLQIKQTALCLACKKRWHTRHDNFREPLPEDIVHFYRVLRIVTLSQGLVGASVRGRGAPSIPVVSLFYFSILFYFQLGP